MSLGRRRQVLGGGLFALAAASGAGLGGCAWLVPPARVPMPTLQAQVGTCSARAPVLIVMLPGIYSAPREFVDEGMVAALRDAGVAADVVVTDAHLGYYNDRSILRRLREDVIQPARARGYARIWLLGVSLGGFGALGYGARHGAEIDGIIVLAPYLGPPALLDEITAAGGPRAWRAATGPIAPPTTGPDDTLDREVWAWLAAPPPATPTPPIYLAHGVSDRFATGHRLLAPLLPAEHVSSAPGGHDWPVWRGLWQRWLAQGVLPRNCA